MSAKKGKKSKGKALSLGEFLGPNNTPNGSSIVIPSKSSWADESEEFESDNFKTGARIVLPTAPRQATSACIDPDRLPQKPPYIAYVANLPFEVENEDFDNFFKGLKISNIRLPHDGVRAKGFGYVEFETKSDLIEALSFNDEPMSGRKIRVDVAEEDSSSRRDGGSQRRDEEREDRSGGVSDWRAAPADKRSPVRDRYDDRNRGYGDRDRDRGYGDRDRDRGFGDRDRDRGFGDRDRDRGYGDRDRNRGYGDRDRGYGDRDRDRGYGDRDRGYGDRDRDRGYGNRDRDRGYGDRDRGYGDRDRGYGDRDRNRGYGDKDRGFGDRDRGRYDKDRYGDGGDRRGGGSSNYDDRRGGGSNSRRDPSPTKERPKLNLQPRTRPAEEKEKKSAEDAPPAETKSSIFGAAKPVNTAQRELEIEKKLTDVQATKDTPAKKVLMPSSKDVFGNAQPVDTSAREREIEEKHRKGAEPKRGENESSGPAKRQPLKLQRRDNGHATDETGEGEGQRRSSKERSESHNQKNRDSDAEQDEDDDSNESKKENNKDNAQQKKTPRVKKVKDEELILNTTNKFSGLCLDEEEA